MSSAWPLGVVNFFAGVRLDLGRASWPLATELSIHVATFVVGQVAFRLGVVISNVDEASLAGQEEHGCRWTSGGSRSSSSGVTRDTSGGCMSDVVGGMPKMMVVPTAELAG